MKKPFIGFCLGVATMFPALEPMAQQSATQPAGKSKDKSDSLPVRTVYDARGTPAGQFFPRSSPAQADPAATSSALLDVDGALINVNVVANYANEFFDPTTLRWEPAATYTYFLAEACRGDPLITSAVPGTRPVALLRNASGDFIAYIGQQGLPSIQAPQSYIIYPGTQQCLPLLQPVQVRAWPLEKVVNISQQYPEPLTVR